MTALRAFITIGLALFWLALTVPPIFQTPPSAYTGTHIISTDALIQPNLVRVDPDSPAYRAGLRTGDVLGCLSPRDAVLLLNNRHASLTRAYRRGVIISTCVRRNGAEFPVHFAAQPGPPLTNSYGSNLWRRCAS